MTTTTPRTPPMSESARPTDASDRETLSVEQREILREAVMADREVLRQIATAIRGERPIDAKLLLDARETLQRLLSALSTSEARVEGLTRETLEQRERISELVAELEAEELAHEAEVARLTERVEAMEQALSEASGVIQDLLWGDDEAAIDLAPHVFATIQLALGSSTGRTPTEGTR